MRVLLDLLIPSLCDGCGGTAPPPWCDDCDEIAMSLRPDTPCPRCAAADVSGHACWPADAPVTRLTALTSWRDPVARAVVHAKLAGRAEVLRALAPRLAALLPVVPDVVVPVPTHPRQARRRGRDHTRVLASSVAAWLGRPYVPALRTASSLTDRGRVAVGQRPPLPGDAFAAARGAAAVRGVHAVLVDDLVTTGATLAACAAALRDCGAARVDGLVVARAGDHDLVG